MQQDSGIARFTRRDAIRVLAAGTGLGAVSALTGGPDLVAGLQRTGGSGSLTRRLPRGSIVRTLLRDVPAEALGTGAVLFHEHLSINLAGLGRGGIARRTNVHIVASGGFYMQRVYPPDIATRSEDQLADDLVRQATEGRLGAFGEIGEDPNGAELTLDERKVFRAVGKAAVRTGVPVFTHNSYGTGPNVPKDIGLQQLDILESTGLRPDRMAIGHTCCLNDPQVAIIKEIARRGAFVGFDRVTTVQQIMPDEQKVAMALALLDAGHSDKLLLSADFTGQRTLDAGPGYGRTLTVFVPMLRKAGVDEATLHTIVYDNPRRFLAFVPKKTSSSI